MTSVRMPRSGLRRGSAVGALMVWVVAALMPVPRSAAVAQQSYAAAIATESNNQHKLVWTQGRLYVTHAKVVDGVSQVFVDVSADGQTWKPFGQISRGDASSTLSTIVEDPAGRLHVAWTRFDAGIGRVYYSRYDSRWSAPAPLSSATSYAGYPCLDVDSHGVIHLVWYGIREGSAGQPTSHGGIYEIYHLTHRGRWSRPERLSGGFPDAVNAALAVDGRGRPHATWFQSDGQTFQIYYAVRDRSWRRPVALTSGTEPSSKPAIAIDLGGRAHLVWEHLTRGRTDIYYASGASGGWSQPVRLAEDARHPTVGIWARGVFVLWETGRDVIVLRAFDGAWGSARQVGRGAYPNATPWKAAGRARPSAVWTVPAGIRIMNLAPVLSSRQ